MELSCRDMALPAATRMGPVHLTVSDLDRSLDYYRTIIGFDVLPAGTTMGHVHLKVAAIPATVEFYRDVLGFDLVVERVPQAAFLSAGGYHHHLGANTWESACAPPPPEDSAALRHATVVLPSAEARDEVVRRVAGASQEPEETATGTFVRDPSGNAVLLAATNAPASAQTQ